MGWLRRVDCREGVGVGQKSKSANRCSVRTRPRSDARKDCCRTGRSIAAPAVCRRNRARSGAPALAWPRKGRARPAKPRSRLRDDRQTRFWASCRSRSAACWESPSAGRAAWRWAEQATGPQHEVVREVRAWVVLRRVSQDDGVCVWPSSASIRPQRRRDPASAATAASTAVR